MVFFLSLKTDTSEAYDRVEWSFLECMLRVLGFPEKWVLSIMNCVTTVRYQVQVNSNLYESVKLDRGLRQGDPISPYLFILCVKWLSRKIKFYQDSNRLKDIKVCRGAPAISHPFFAIDSIFFLKANVSNASILSTILRNYQLFSENKINMANSEMVRMLIW